MYPQWQRPEEPEIPITFIQALVQPQHCVLIIRAQRPQQPDLSIDPRRADACFLLIAGIGIACGHVPLLISNQSRAAADSCQTGAIQRAWICPDLAFPSRS
jgi:hypothetical protein